MAPTGLVAAGRLFAPLLRLPAGPLHSLQRTDERLGYVLPRTDSLWPPDPPTA